MVDYKAVVVGGVGIINKAVLAALRPYEAHEMEAVPLLGLPPKLIYRVRDGAFNRLTTDPVDVRHMTRAHRDATVEIIPVIA
jgi:hypothetical protein